MKLPRLSPRAQRRALTASAVLLLATLYLLTHFDSAPPQPTPALVTMPTQSAICLDTQDNDQQAPDCHPASDRQ